MLENLPTPLMPVQPSPSLEPSKSEALRICFVSQYFPIQSRSTDQGLLWPMARGLAAKGHSVSVLSWKNSVHLPILEREGVQVFSPGEELSETRVQAREEWLFKKFVEIHQQNQFQLVHFLDATGAKIRRKKKTLGVRIGVDVEATEMSQIFSILGLSDGSARSILLTGVAVLYKFLSTYWGKDRRLLESADGVFVTTPQQKTYLERYYRFPEHWTTLVPYAVEVSNLIEQADQKKARERLGISESSGIVVTFSDMNENFSLKPVLKAFAKVSLKKPLAKLIVIGMGPAFKSLERMVLDLALGSRVLFVGPKDGDELRDWISACDVYLDLGTRSTGYDPMMIEAMSQQKIVIGSEVGPIAHVIENGSDGFLIRPADSESLAHVLLECFLGAVSTADVGIRARSKVLHLFDARQMVKSLEDAYRKILSS